MQKNTKITLQTEFNIGLTRLHRNINTAKNSQKAHKKLKYFSSFKTVMDREGCAHL